MSLRRRITAVVTLAVAAIALLVGTAGYLATRAQLIGGVRSALTQRADALLARQQAQTRDGFRFGGAPLMGDANGSGGAAGFGHGGPGDAGRPPPGPAFGGAPGYFQLVPAHGAAVAFATNATPKLPVTAEVRRVAAGTTANFFFSAQVQGHHLEILVARDPTVAAAAEIALPLNDVDRALSGLLLVYGLIVGGGVLVAILIGRLVAASALAPVDRFIAATASVTRSLAAPRRLEGGGAEELARLAVSFNETLEALERSVTAQRHLIADASHELRTPLAALRSNIQIFLEAEALPEGEQAELQAAILAEIDDLTQLVSDVLELARGEAPADTLEEVELDGVIRDAVARTQRRAPGLVFELTLEPTVIVNSSDRVGRAVQNLIDNARKWSPPGGPVEVRLAGGVLSVRDHGPGFGEADLPLVFDRFFRADDARRMPGSGLGLAIVRQAAEAHGGWAAATNAPAGGAILTVCFSANPERGSRGRAAPSASAA